MAKLWRTNKCVNRSGESGPNCNQRVTSPPGYARCYAPKAESMSPHRRVQRAIAVGIAGICLAACVIFLASLKHGSPTPIPLKPAQAPSGNAVSFTDPALGSLIKTQTSRLSEISDHHRYGMCGSVHFYRFQYTDQSDIAAIISANDLSVAKPPAVDGVPNGMNLNGVEWDSGMNHGPFWKSPATKWHVPATSATVYSGVVSAGYCYLFVDRATLTAYLEVAYGYP